jgi:hypothetical protein
VTLFLRPLGPYGNRASLVYTQGEWKRLSSIPNAFTTLFRSMSRFETVRRLLARRASRRPGTPLERKVDAFGVWTPKFWGEREIIFNYFPKYINIFETK